MTSLRVSRIRTDGGTQPRSTILQDVVEEYAAAMVDGAEFPSVTVFYDGTDYWLADGFHRVAAASAAGLAEINSDVRQGTRRDAVLHSVGANATHGMRRTNEDKRRAVRVLLEDPEWAQWSDREIARRCGVSPTSVGALRPSEPDTVQVGQYEPRTFVHPKTGQPTQMRTANIGGRKGAEFIDNSATWHKSGAYDAPVFDSTPAGERGAWSPQDIEPAPARPSRDASGDYIHHALTEIVRQFDKLPSPETASARYPVDLSHALPVETINRIADWFSVFAPEWEGGADQREAWMKSLIEKVKEKAVVNA